MVTLIAGMVVGYLINTGQVATSQNTIIVKDREISNLQNLLRETESQIKERDNRINILNQKVENLNQTIQELQAKIEELNAILSSKNETTIIKITGAHLFSGYINDEVEADSKYGGRILWVLGSKVETGKIPQGYGEYSGKTYIRIYKHPVGGIGVLIFLKDESVITTLKPGYWFVVEGKCLGIAKIFMTSDIILVDCTIVEIYI